MMHLECSQCKEQFDSLSKLYVHCQKHVEAVTVQHHDSEYSKERMFNAVKSVLEYFYPKVCPHCERFIDPIPDSDITKFIEGG